MSGRALSMLFGITASLFFASDAFAQVKALQLQPNREQNNQPRMVVPNQQIAPSQRPPSTRDRGTGRQPPAVRPEDVFRMLIPQHPANPTYPPSSRPPYPPQVTPRRPAVPAAPAKLPVPTTDQVAKMSIDQQRNLLRSALNRLDDALSGVRTGSSWKTHLQTVAIAKALEGRIASPPDAATRKQLRDIAVRFDQVAQNPKYRWIHQLWGFRVAHNTLPEFAIEPADRHARDVAGSTAVLQDQLNRLSVGRGWIAFLNLRELDRIAKTPTNASTADHEKLKAILASFDKVSRDPKFASVADTPGFQSTLGNLTALVADFESRSDNPTSAGGPMVATDPLFPPEKKDPSGITTNLGGAVFRPDLVIANVVYDDTKQTAIVTVANIGGAKAEKESQLHVKIVGFNEAPPPDWSDPRQDHRAMAIGDKAARPPVAGGPGAPKPKLVARAAIPFVAFNLVDPNTNKNVDPNAMIEVPDPKVDAGNGDRVPMTMVRAGTYYNALNMVEEDFSRQGYTLRDDGPIRFQAAAINTVMIDQQIAAIQAAHQGKRLVMRSPIIPHGQAASGPPEPSKTLQVDPGLGNIDFGKMFNTYLIPRLAPNTWTKIQITAPDARIGFNLQIRLTADVGNVVPEMRENNNVWIDKRLDEDNPDVMAEIAADTNVIDTVRQWHQDFGDPDYFAAYMTVKMQTHASFNLAKAAMHASAGVTMFNKDIEALYVDISAATPAHSEGKTSFVARIKGEPMGPNELERSVEAYHEMRFALGPIPMVVTFTASVHGGVRNGLTAKNGHALVTLEPFLYVAVTAKGGVDIFIAGGGVGVNVNLLSYDGKATVEAIVRRIDRKQQPDNQPAAPVSDRTLSETLTENFGYAHSFTALGGEAYVYAYIWVPKPTWTNPFRFKKKQWDWTLVDWDSPIQEPRGADDGKMVELFGDTREIPLFK